MWSPPTDTIPYSDLGGNHVWEFGFIIPMAIFMLLVFYSFSYTVYNIIMHVLKVYVNNTTQYNILPFALCKKSSIFNICLCCNASRPNAFFWPPYDITFHEYTTNHIPILPLMYVYIASSIWLLQHLHQWIFLHKFLNAIMQEFP